MSSNSANRMVLKSLLHNYFNGQQRFHLPDSDSYAATQLNMSEAEYLADPNSYLDIFVLSNDPLKRSPLKSYFYNLGTVVSPPKIGGIDSGGFVVKTATALLRISTTPLGLPKKGALVFIMQSFLEQVGTAAYEFIVEFIDVNRTVAPSEQSNIIVIADWESLSRSERSRYVKGVNIVEYEDFTLNAMSFWIEEALKQRKIKYDVRFFDHLYTYKVPFDLPYLDSQTYKTNPRKAIALFDEKKHDAFCVSQSPISVMFFNTVCRSAGHVLKNPQSYPTIDIAELSQNATVLSNYLKHLFPYTWSTTNESANAQFYFQPLSLRFKSAQELLKLCAQNEGLNKQIQHIQNGGDTPYASSFAFFHKIMKLLKMTPIAFCNTLSILQGLTPFYNLDIELCDVRENPNSDGYRLLSQLEFTELSTGLPLYPGSESWLASLNDQPVLDLNAKNRINVGMISDIRQRGIAPITTNDINALGLFGIGTTGTEQANMVLVSRQNPTITSSDVLHLMDIMTSVNRLRTTIYKPSKGEPALANIAAYGYQSPYVEDASVRPLDIVSAYGPVDHNYIPSSEIDGLTAGSINITEALDLLNKGIENNVFYVARNVKKP